MLLKVLHVEIEMKNINLQVTLLMWKGVGMPFPPHYTPAGRSDANQWSSLAWPTANLALFILSLPDMLAAFCSEVCRYRIYVVIDNIFILIPVQEIRLYKKTPQWMFLCREPSIKKHIWKNLGGLQPP